MPSIQHSLGFSVPMLLVRTGTISDWERRSNPLLKCLFVPWLPGQGGYSSQDATIKNIPLGQALDLRPGEVLHPDGFVQGHPRIETFRSRVLINTLEMTLHERNALVSQGILPKNPFSTKREEEAEILGGPGGTDATYWTIAKSLETTFEDLAIPSIELFWAYYAPNSKLANAYFDGSILDTIQELFEDPRNTLSKGSAELHLGTGRLVSDAIPLGRIRFDSTSIARDLAQGVAAGIMMAKKGRKPFPLQCSFPFIGEATLTYQAIAWTQSSGKVTHLVVRLCNCDFPLPWKTLDAYLEQSKHSPDQTSVDGRRPGTRFEDFGDDLVRLDPDESPPTADDAAVARPKATTTFSNPGPRALEIHRRKSDTNTTSFGPKLRKAKRHSAHRPRDDGDNTTQEARVAPIGGNDPGGERSSEISPVAALCSVTAALDELRDLEGCSCEVLHLPLPRLRYGTWTINEFPARTSLRSHHWATIRNGTQKRCFLAACVQRADKSVYLLEILRNPAERFSTLLMRPASGAISVEDFMVIIHGINDKQGMPSDIALNKMMPNVNVIRVRHPSADRAPSSQPLRRVVLELLEVS